MEWSKVGLRRKPPIKSMTKSKSIEFPCKHKLEGIIFDCWLVDYCQDMEAIDRADDNIEQGRCGTVLGSYHA